MYFKHNSFDLNFREPFGARPIGSRVLLTVETQDVMNIRLRTFFDGKERIFDMLPTDRENRFSCTVQLPNQPGLFWYDFIFDAYGKTYRYGTRDQYGGEGRVYEEMPPSYQITLYDKDRSVPKWYKEGIMYQIFPDRFYKSDAYKPTYFKNSMVHGNWNDTPHYFRNKDGSIAYWDYFGGNLDGITEKLDYLKELNITILYLNPIFEAISNHKYNTADYKKISPDFGDEAAFKRLCAEAKKRGMRVILDGVFSHTGDDSKYFNKYDHFDSVGAYQSKDSSYYSWYRFSKYPDEYESWWGIGNMPNVDELNKDYQNYIFKDDDSVIRKWTRAGASGWRLDVADELPDTFIKNLKSALMEESEDNVLIGEVWENASNKVAYGVHRQYFMGHELDAVMNYPFRQAFLDYLLYHISGQEANRQMMSLYECYPPGQFMGNMNLIGSHDRARVLTLLAGVSGDGMSESQKEGFRLNPDQRAIAIKRLKLLSLIQMTFPGVPCIYYGDEAGMEGFEDPFNRGPYPWGHENKELLGWYRTITTLRTESLTLKRGYYYPLATDDADLLGYLRIYKHEAILCLFNRSDKAYKTYQNPALKGHQGYEMLKNVREKLDGITLEPLSAHIYKLQRRASDLFNQDDAVFRMLVTEDV